MKSYEILRKEESYRCQKGFSFELYNHQRQIMIGRMCVYLTKGSYTQCQKHLLVIQLLLMHVQIKPTQQQLADVVVVLCCVNSTIDAKELFSVHQTNTTEKLSLLEDAFLFYVSRNVFQHFFGIIKETLSLCQPNDLIRKTVDKLLLLQVSRLLFIVMVWIGKIIAILCPSFRERIFIQT